MLVCSWGKRNTDSLLVVVKAGAATVEISMAFLKCWK